jgi:hypothetical protein
VVRIPAALHGRWRSVLTGDEHDLGAEMQVATLAGPLAVALLERA